MIDRMETSPHLSLVRENPEMRHLCIRRWSSPGRGILLALLVLASSLLCWGKAVSLAPRGEGLGVGKAAPDFITSTLDGQRLTLEMYRGRPIVLNFWATWCKPCREEMPLLQKTYTTHQSAGLVVVALSQDSMESLEIVRSYLTTANLTFPAVMDTDGAIATQFQVLLLPSTIFIDATGTITAVHLGPLHEARLAQYVAMIMPPPG